MWRSTVIPAWEIQFFNGAFSLSCEADTRLREDVYCGRSVGQMAFYPPSPLQLPAGGMCATMGLSSSSCRFVPKGKMESMLVQKADATKAKATELKLAHSPDSDDAFMFYAIATKKIRTGNLRFTHVLEDIETLNQKALEETYDVTAISFHGYAYLADRYILLTTGASFGDKYGPIVVSRGKLKKEDLEGKRIAIPGKMTSACLAMRLFEPGIETVITPFDKILQRVADGDVDAGVVIHEGQLTYAELGLKKVVDLGAWWHEQTGLPLPLGGNAIRRAIDPKTRSQVGKFLRESIEYGLANREEALDYAMQFARGLDLPTADRFVAMYVNDWTIDYGEKGRQAVQTLLDRGYEKGILPRALQAEFVD
jgi:5,8-dihydroxy-2-naphthoate synthase